MKKTLFVLAIILCSQAIFSNEKLILKNNYNYYLNKKVTKPINFSLKTDNDDENEDSPFEEKNTFTLEYNGENVFRRAEILFFGSLAIVAFFGWLGFSAYNSIMYESSFGVLQRHQFLSLYLGSSAISLAVSISDIFIRQKTKMKNVEIY